MLRKHKVYSRPKKRFDKARIIEEGDMVNKYGLKNKKEIWRVEAKVKSIREKAKKLIGKGPEEQELLFNQLRKMGIKVNSIPDVLGLNKEDILKRRLQSVMVQNHISTTPKGARQLITHKKVLVDDKIINSPSYIVPVNLEKKITLKPTKVKKVKTESAEIENA
ncbi:30S ribosomal protein S4 [Candidatus Pacearchaeota archaeon CG10_big_fil_rev_8_21_14_0_10_32_14]|nr:MAG: 30S ribosomal protein S4 [Candidatus Pacearchaeota archaeon CG10_big_fil_rev_8_21_14_0_10_32_14]